MHLQDTPQTAAQESGVLVVTIPEAATMLACSEATIYRIIREKRLPVVKVTADTTRISVSSLREFVLQNQTPRIAIEPASAPSGA
jgi:excisionase family DNA binding protein